MDNDKKKFSCKMDLIRFADDICQWDSGMIYVRKSDLVKFLDANKDKKIKISLERV